MDENQIYYLGRVEKNTIVLKQNSKTPSKYVNSLENYMKNAPTGVNFCDCQGADDNPDKGTMSICMTFVNDDHSWGVQYLFVYERIRYRIMSNGAVDEWRRII